MKETVNNYNGALQKPLNSGFSATTATHDIIKEVNLQGKIAIVTGGYAGIGLETVKTLAGAGAKVIVPARNIEKATENLKGIDAEVWQMDLMNPESINDFAQKFLNLNVSLDLLINNAGIMWVPLRRDVRGYESQLSTNHLGHFQLTAMLWSALKKAGHARVVTVSSFGHQTSPFDFEDPNFITKEYETLTGYGQSKSANILFTVELAERGKKHGINAYSVHPGAVKDTDLGREASVELFQQLGMCDAEGNILPELEAKLKTIEQGAATTIWCAINPSLQNVSGVYCENCDVAVMDNGDIQHIYNDPNTLYGVKPYAVDYENAKKLWTLSEEMTGITFLTN
ncbi:SDR family NAD(P)-dependent oxidoreductase [Flavobacterium sp. LaA7.5]|nr:SDR family NAD(P)-dependent oxidoreductase [Flavobacterium salilacus subsp. altitudinum]